MKTLKEALHDAMTAAETSAPDDWRAVFLASLESNGYCIVPMEATGAMNQLGMASIADAMEEGDMLTPGEVFTKMLAARPKIED